MNMFYEDHVWEVLKEEINIGKISEEIEKRAWEGLADFFVEAAKEGAKESNILNLELDNHGEGVQFWFSVVLDDDGRLTYRRSWKQLLGPESWLRSERITDDYNPYIANLKQGIAYMQDLVKVYQKRQKNLDEGNEE